MIKEHNLRELAEKLSPLERRVLPEIKKKISVSELNKKTKLSDVEIARALQLLANKNLVKLERQEEEFVVLGELGKIYEKKGLPERVLLNQLARLKAIRFEDAFKIGLNEEEVKAAIGVLKQKMFIAIDQDRIILKVPAEETRKPLLEEKFLEEIPLSMDLLTDIYKLAFKNLQKRKQIISIEKKKEIFSELTELGRKVSEISSAMKEDLIENLTSEILRTGKFEGKKFRRYDIHSHLPAVSGGRRHFVNESVEYIRNIWLSLGFKEMNGPLVESSFWNFDALFVPQDHPAKELQDTLYVKGKGKLPDARLVKTVRQAHEQGIAGSKGWQYKWNEEDAKRIVMRTHTTSLSARTLAYLKQKQNDLPAKFFSVGKVFRNETLDPTHLFEFYQSEGIVVSENVNFKHLLGYLREFFKALGFEKIKFRPGYFPYTEMSVEPTVYHPIHKKWIELGGAGIFRPEVVVPLLGKDIPVLAWGLGLERGIMDYYNMSDVRDLYKNDLKQLREIKSWMKL